MPKSAYQTLCDLADVHGWWVELRVDDTKQLSTLLLRDRSTKKVIMVQSIRRDLNHCASTCLRVIARKKA